MMGYFSFNSYSPNLFVKLPIRLFFSKLYMSFVPDIKHLKSRCPEFGAKMQSLFEGKFFFRTMCLDID